MRPSGREPAEVIKSDNVQFPILNSHPIGIENWELNINGFYYFNFDSLTIRMRYVRYLVVADRYARAASRCGVNGVLSGLDMYFHSSLEKFG